MATNNTFGWNGSFAATHQNTPTFPAFGHLGGQTFGSQGAPQAVDPKSNVRGMSHEEAVASMFGPPNANVQQEAGSDLPVEARILPFAWRGQPGSAPSFYKNNYIRVMLRNELKATELFWTTDIFPFEDHDGGPSVLIEKIVFNDALPDAYPEQGTPRLLTNHYSSWWESIQRYGLAFMMEMGFYLTAMGVQQYFMSIMQIRDSMYRLAIFLIINRLLTQINQPETWQQAYGCPYNNASLQTVQEWEINNWNILNKKHGADQLVSNVKRVLSNYNVTADTVIVTDGTGDRYNRTHPEKTDYMVAGPAGPARLESGTVMAGSFTGFKIIELLKFNMCNGSPPDDMLVRERSVGEFFLFNPVNLSDVPPHKFQSKHQNITIHDRKADKLAELAIDTAFRMTGLFGEDGHLSDEIGVPWLGGWKTFGQYLEDVNATKYIEPTFKRACNVAKRGDVATTEMKSLNAILDNPDQCNSAQWYVPSRQGPAYSFEDLQLVVDNAAELFRNGPPEDRKEGPSRSWARAAASQYSRQLATGGHLDHIVPDPDQLNPKIFTRAFSKAREAYVDCGETWGLYLFAAAPKFARKLIHLAVENKIDPTSIIQHLKALDSYYGSEENNNLLSRIIPFLQGKTLDEAAINTLSQTDNIRNFLHEFINLGVDQADQNELRGQLGADNERSEEDGDQPSSSLRLSSLSERKQPEASGTVEEGSNFDSLWKKLRACPPTYLHTKVFDWFFRNNVMLPFNILVFRPWMRANMASAIFLKRGAETGVCRIGFGDFEFGTDAIRKMLIGHYTNYIGPIVKKPENSYVARNVQEIDYVAGGSVEYYDPRTPVDINNIFKNGVAAKDLFAVILPFGWIPDENFVDITGILPEGLLGATDYGGNKTKLMYPLAERYSLKWKWTHSAHYMEEFQVRTFHAENNYNTRCFSGTQYVNTFNNNTVNHNGGRMTGTGHYRSIYNGARADCCGLGNGRIIPVNDVEDGAKEVAHVRIGFL